MQRLPPPSPPTHWVVMGVAGCGKSTLGAALADRLGLPFLDGDDFHCADARARMAAGLPLDDALRAPWLARLNAALCARPTGAVLACSALKADYRLRLAHGLADVRWLWLDADRDTLQQRLNARVGHFFAPSLLDSQLATLEPPGAEALRLDARDPLGAWLAAIEPVLAADR